MDRYPGKGLLLGIPLLAVVYFIYNPGQTDLFPRCMFFSVTGYYCPGCGSQRAVHHLLHLNFPQVMHNNMLLLPAMVAIGYHYSHPVLNNRLNLKLPGILYRKHTPCIVLIVVFLYWVLRNLPVFPFTALAPELSCT